MFFTCCALMGVTTVKAENSLKTVISVNEFVSIHGKLVAHQQRLTPAIGNSAILAFLFGCATSTASVTDSYGYTVSFTATYCNDIDAIAVMGAQNRARDGLTIKLYGEM